MCLHCTSLLLLVHLCLPAAVSAFYLPACLGGDLKEGGRGGRRRREALFLPACLLPVWHYNNLPLCLPTNLYTCGKSKGRKGGRVGLYLLSVLYQ